MSKYVVQSYKLFDTLDNSSEAQITAALKVKALKGKIISEKTKEGQQKRRDGILTKKAENQITQVRRKFLTRRYHAFIKDKGRSIKPFKGLKFKYQSPHWERLYNEAIDKIEEPYRNIRSELSWIWQENHSQDPFWTEEDELLQQKRLNQQSDFSEFQ